MKILLLVGLGGAVGSMLRYLTTLFVMNRMTGLSFPLGTFIVNVTGCLLIGIVFGLSERYQWMTPQFRIFLMTGICGGYTTFSAFAFENIRLFQESAYITSFMYIAASLLSCLLAVFLGMMCVKYF